MVQARTQLARKGRRERFILLGGLVVLLVVRLLFALEGRSALDVALVLLSVTIGVLVVAVVITVLVDRHRRKAELRARPDEWFRNVGSVKPVELLNCGLAPPQSVVKIGSFWTTGHVGADVAVAADGLRIYPNARGQRAGMTAFTVPWSWVRDAELAGMATLGGGVLLVVQYTDGREFSVQTSRRADLQRALDRVAA